MAVAPAKVKPTIIIKRVKKRGHGGHHGGAWKIAYADFVTAMMAFFLLMWLLGSTSKGELNGIAEYFSNPVKVAMGGGSGSGDSSSVLNGGGTDLTRSNGQVKKGDIEAEKRSFNMKALRADLRKADAERMAKLMSGVEAMLDNDARLKQFRNQIRLDITKDGLRIQIVDDQNRPMFDTGRAEVKDYMRDLLRKLGGVLNEVDNKVAVSGHTDAYAYQNGDRGYGNWELSADRANASRRELVAGGMADNKIFRVVGLAASAPLNAEDPMDPTNRRITIVVMNKEAEARLTRGSGQIEIEDADDLAETIKPLLSSTMPSKSAKPSVAPTPVPTVATPTNSSAAATAFIEAPKPALGVLASTK